MPINLNLPKKAGLFITGTNTSVGKTLIAGAIAKILTEKSLKVGVFKPITTGCHRHWAGLGQPRYRIPGKLRKQRPATFDNNPSRLPN